MNQETRSNQIDASEGGVVLDDFRVDELADVAELDNGFFGSFEYSKMIKEN